MSTPVVNERGTYITFAYRSQSASGKTRIWFVCAEDSQAIGQVRWHGPWRKYVFAPGDGTIFEQVCLREIAAFCERKTKEHKTEQTDD